MSVTQNNSWYGFASDLGTYELDVWYNTSTTSEFHRTIVNVVPTVTYASNYNKITKQQAFSIIPNNIDCDSCLFTISPELPDGIEFNYTDVSISGNSSTLVSNRSFIITSLNSSGKSEMEIYLEIVDYIPVINSSTTSLNFVKGFRNQSNDLTNLGGEAVYYEIYPPISGLSANNMPNKNVFMKPLVLVLLHL